MVFRTMSKLILLMFVTNICFAQTYGSSAAVQACDIDALRISKIESRNCNDNRPLYEKDICQSNVNRKLSSAVCAQELKIIFNNISELWKQMSYLDKNYRNYKFDDYIKKTDEIADLIKKELDEGVNIAMSDMRRSEVDYYKTKAQRNINTSMLIIGAIPQNQNNSTQQFQTYILNGRMINCMTTGNMTSCN